MAVATAVVVNDRPGGHHFTGSFTLAAASLAVDTEEVETVTIPGARVGDLVLITSRTQLLAGLVIEGARVSANDTVQFKIMSSASTQQQPSGIFDFVIIRGTTGPLR